MSSHFIGATSRLPSYVGGASIAPSLHSPTTPPWICLSRRSATSPLGLPPLGCIVSLTRASRYLRSGYRPSLRGKGPTPSPNASQPSPLRMSRLLLCHLSVSWQHSIADSDHYLCPYQRTWGEVESRCKGGTASLADGDEEETCIYRTSVLTPAAQNQRIFLINIKGSHQS